MRVDKGRPAQKTWFEGQHRFEHWYVDNQVYLITSRVRGRYRAFATTEACSVFWDRFEHYTSAFGFSPFVTSLIPNHYHMVGYLSEGKNLGSMMQRLHGSIAKLVNDLLEQRITPFWWDHGGQGYFDGCLRDANQLQRSYRYVLNQSVRHGLARRVQDYPNTRITVPLDTALSLAQERRALLEGVPYKLYDYPDEPPRR
jgi:hypothetical protein